MAAELYIVANHFRSELLARDAATTQQLIRSYLIAARNIRQRVLQLGERIDQARANGERISPSWFYQQERLSALLTQVQNEIISFAGSANITIEGMQREMAMLGLTHAADLFVIGNPGVTLSGGFARLPAQAAVDLVGFASDGSPLASLLAKLAPGAADTVKQTLFSGVIQGIGAKALARDVHNSLGGNMARSLLIARTETLRAYRESSQRFYEANDDVVSGWKWIAACNARTCPVCWAMHGSLHSNTEQFTSHPGCRCTPVPVTDISPPLKAGPARFAEIPEKQQLKVLGPLKFEAYQTGRISLQDLVGTSTNKQWGTSLRERSLKDALADPRGETLPRLPDRSRIKNRRQAA
jgi:SPP1 gp7 family putative phage head morphogenesis protein